MTKIRLNRILNQKLAIQPFTFLLLMFIPFTISAKTVQIAASWAKPPYIIPQTHSGFEIELVTQVFSQLNLDVSFVYMPYARTVEMLKRKQIDMALTLNNLSGVESDDLSDVYVFYQNVALSLKSKKLAIRTVKDLANHSVVGFQSASNVLGADFTAAVKNNRLYLEVADQKRQLELLLTKQVDVIIIDLNVFQHLSIELTGTDQFDNVVVHPFFAANPYKAGFKNKALKTQFNRVLAQYLSSESYDTLKKKYHFKDMIYNVDDPIISHL
jgi:polar amino acid transport system substrate-binding protein